MKPLKHAQYIPDHNYLKYFRTVEYYFCKKYELSRMDLQMILFLYSENYFTKTKFIEFSQFTSFNNKRFDKLVKAGHIQTWRKKNHKWTTKYELTTVTKRMVTRMYEILNGEKAISEHSQNNPLFLVDVPYMHKVHRNLIREMNAEFKVRNNFSKYNRDVSNGDK